jgi:hypothetical protein
MERSVITALVIGGLTTITGCKLSKPDNAAGGSSLSSVSVAIPAAVQGKIGSSGKASLRAYKNDGKYGTREFTEILQFGTSGQKTKISFKTDSQGNALKVGDSLGGVILEIQSSSGKVVYKGDGEPSDMSIRSGANSIRFALKCVATDLCNSQEDLQVIPVDGVAGDNNSVSSATLDVEITVDQDGMTLEQRRAAVASCQNEVKKKSCDEWGLSHNNGKATCNKIVTANVTTVYSSATFSQSIDSLVNDCKALGVLR